MKKHGFTLAEVLITLGIVGVVAALTAPALVQNAGSAQIGPKLAKAVNTFEVANENLLSDTGAATVVGAGATGGDLSSGAANYINTLSNYMKMNYTDESNVSAKYHTLIRGYNGEVDIKDSDPGTEYGLDDLNIPIAKGKQAKVLSASKTIGITKEGYLIGIMLESEYKTDVIDYRKYVNNILTGSTAHKQQIGTVVIDINGYTKPNRLGRDAFAFLLMADGSLLPVGYNGAWNTSGHRCNSDTVEDLGYTCAGSIFENNQKVIYQ